MTDSALPAGFRAGSTPQNSGPTRLEIRALRSPLGGRFDLQLAAHQCAAISGASGSGKTLLLRMIADLDPSEGEAFVDGVDRATLSGPEWRRNVVYLAAESGWWRDRPIEHIAAEHVAEARSLALRLGVVADRLDAPVHDLSSGERQRLALVRALVLSPLVLLLDEPTAQLDPQSTRAVETLLLERLSRGTAIVLVTHDADQANRMAKEHYRLIKRRLERAA